MHNAALALALLVLAAPASAREPFAMTTPSEGTWGPIVLALIEHERARPSGGYWCPPPGPDETEDDASICLGADLVEGPATILRYLSLRPDGWRDPGTKPRVRFIGAHAVRWVDAGVRVAILEQTESGHLWRAWSTSIDDGWACFDPAMIEAFQLTTRLSWRRHGGANHCLPMARLR